MERGLGVKIIDRQFRLHPLRYVWQCLLASVAIMVILLLMENVRAHTTLIASLGASTFIAFTMPEARVSRGRFLIGGYLVAVAVGVSLHYLHVWTGKALRLSAAGPNQELALVLFAGLAVGLAIFVMVITNTEHPPAAGVALGLMVSPAWDLRILLVLVGSIVALVVLHVLLRPFLKNLL